MSCLLFSPKVCCMNLMEVFPTLPEEKDISVGNYFNFLIFIFTIYSISVFDTWWNKVLTAWREKKKNKNPTLWHWGTTLCFGKTIGLFLWVINKVGFGFMFFRRHRDSWRSNARKLILTKVISSLRWGWQLILTKLFYVVDQRWDILNIIKVGLFIFIFILYDNMLGFYPT